MLEDLMREGSRDGYGGLFFVGGAVVATLGVVAFFVLAKEEGAGRRGGDTRIEAPASPAAKP